MRTIILILLMLVSHAGVFSQQKALTQVKVHLAAESILTPYDISCDKFKKSFPREQIKVKEITDPVILKKTVHALQTVKYARKLAYPLDVRNKFYLTYSDGSTLVICSDKFNQVEVSGRAIKANKKIISLLTLLKS